MQRIYIVIFFTCCLLHSSFSQTPGEWTWMNGDSTSAQLASFGTKGVASPTNHPSALYEFCEWVDAQGNFWLFGGYTTNIWSYGDLWKYDLSTNMWNWINGPGLKNVNPVYGAKGVPSASNHPGTRCYGICNWKDAAGNFWIFGGFSQQNGFYNDLWKYDISTGMWTWMSGSNSVNSGGVYGTKGIPSVNNSPQSRTEVATAWTDNAGDFWLFGGQASGSNLRLNDLWKYHPATNEWTWMSGSSTTNAPAIYGTKGVSAPTNNPSARWSYSHWKDKAGNLWLFGGYSPSPLNDLWKYDIATNEWTWMSGTNLASQPGRYGVKCREDANNIPSGRMENKSVWTDSCGNFWMMGGSGGGYSNDLWRYNPSGNVWMWVSGDTTLNVNGIYGTKGVSAPTNRCGNRGGAGVWMESNGNLWLYGGFTGQGLRSDMWRYVPDPACGGCAQSVIPPVADFTASDSSFCANDCISFTNQSSNATSYQWFFTGATPSFSTDQNPFVCYQTAGTYDVKLIASNSGGKDSLTISNFIDVKPAPPTPSISQSGTTLYCSTHPSYSSYQWYDSTTIIPGATDTSLIITHGGNYNVQVSNKDGCKIAVGINIVLGVKQFTVSGLRFTVVPNPVKDELIIAGSGKVEDGSRTVTIFNTLGEIIYTEDLNSKQSTVNCKPFSPGIYFVQILGERDRWVGKFIKE